MKASMANLSLLSSPSPSSSLSPSSSSPPPTGTTLKVPMTTSKLIEQFNNAVKVIQSIPKDGPFQPSNEQKLKFYSFFKQSREGPCHAPKPAFWDVVAKAKWESWKKLGAMSADQAMEGYIDGLLEIIEVMPHTDDVGNFIISMRISNNNDEDNNDDVVCEHTDEKITVMQNGVDTENDTENLIVRPCPNKCLVDGEYFKDESIDGVENIKSESICQDDDDDDGDGFFEASESTSQENCETAHLSALTSGPIVADTGLLSMTLGGSHIVQSTTKVPRRIICKDDRGESSENSFAPSTVPVDVLQSLTDSLARLHAEVASTRDAVAHMEYELHAIKRKMKTEQAPKNFIDYLRHVLEGSVEFPVLDRRKLIHYIVWPLVFRILWQWVFSRRRGRK